MQSLKWTWIMAIAAVAVLAMACGGGDTKTLLTRERVDAEKIQQVSAAGGQDLTAADAGSYLGLLAKICGTVVKTVHEPEHPRGLTFLYFDKAEDPDFYVHFPRPQVRDQRGRSWPDMDDNGQPIPSVNLSSGWFDGKKVCVEGRIQAERNVPAMLVTNWNTFKFPEE